MHKSGPLRPVVSPTMGAQLLQMTERGLYCAAGDFYVDPMHPVPFAVITHAHSDHARAGSGRYLASEQCKPVLQERIGASSRIETLPWGKTITRNGVAISFFPAGHILGSSQIRVEHCGEVWVVSGDYKVEPERTCDPFEPIRCDTFITECTFGLPIYRWQPQSEVFDAINEWWRANQALERTSVLYGYSLGKAQRILAGVDASIGPIFVHGKVARFLPIYAAAGIALPGVAGSEYVKGASSAGALVIAPSSVEGSPWLRKFGAISTAFASGWMQLRGARRRQALDRGFVLSDHADWNGLLTAIHETGANRVLATHGSSGPLVRWINL